jgi:hypothetical protein
MRDIMSKCSCSSTSNQVLVSFRSLILRRRPLSLETVVVIEIRMLDIFIIFISKLGAGGVNVLYFMAGC